MNIRDILADIHALEEELLDFERKYGIRSETFYAAYIPPDIKHNRIPAPNMSFTHPNLPALIQEIEELV